MRLPNMALVAAAQSCSEKGDLKHPGECVWAAVETAS